MKIACPCGTVLSDSGDALPHKAHLRPDEVDARYAEAVATDVERMARAFRSADASQAEHILKRDLEEIGMVGVPLERPIFECPSCGRLLLYSPLADSIHVYAPETAVRGVLRGEERKTDQPRRNIVTTKIGY